MITNVFRTWYSLVDDIKVFVERLNRTLKSLKEHHDLRYSRIPELYIGEVERTSKSMILLTHLVNIQISEREYIDIDNYSDHYEYIRETTARFFAELVYIWTEFMLYLGCIIPYYRVDMKKQLSFEHNIQTKVDLVNTQIDNYIKRIGDFAADYSNAIDSHVHMDCDDISIDKNNTDYAIFELNYTKQSFAHALLYINDDRFIVPTYPKLIDDVMQFYLDYASDIFEQETRKHSSFKRIMLTMDNLNEVV
jgi:hypothetical protein